MDTNRRARTSTTIIQLPPGWTVIASPSRTLTPPRGVRSRGTLPPATHAVIDEAPAFGGDEVR